MTDEREREDVPVVLIEPAGPPVKVNEHRGKYAVPVVYVTDDGRRLDATTYHSLLRDAKAYAEALPMHPKEPLTCTFVNGACIGTRTSYYIGPNRNRAKAYSVTVYVRREPDHIGSGSSVTNSYTAETRDEAIAQALKRFAETYPGHEPGTIIADSDETAARFAR